MAGPMKSSPLLNIPQREPVGNSGTVRDERASGAQGHFAGIIHPAIENGVNSAVPRVSVSNWLRGRSGSRGNLNRGARAGIVIAI